MKNRPNILDINDTFKGKSAFARYFRKMLSYITKLDKVNSAYNQLGQNIDPLLTLDLAFKKIGVHFFIDPSELEQIPKEGPVIVVANHPTGLMDALLMVKVLLTVRSDVKILATQNVGMNSCFHDYLIPIDFSEKTTKPITSAFHYLKQNYLIFLFPAGEVSSFNFEKRGIYDITWSRLPLLLAKKMNAPIVPIHLSGRNHFMFYLLGVLHPFFRTSLLPSSFLNKRGEALKIKIGSRILFSTLNHMKVNEARDYLYRITYALPLMKTLISTDATETNDNKEIDTHLSSSLPTMEMVQAELAKEEKVECITQLSRYSVYLAHGKDIPAVLEHIGYERERAFREVKMGAQKTIDIDEYDNNYLQVFIWDRSRLRVAGGYRLNLVKNDFSSITKSYVSSLFDIHSLSLVSIPSFLELGRSFVTLEYQNNKLLLDILLKGISKIILRHSDEAEFLFGLVSFSPKSYPAWIVDIFFEYLRTKSQNPPAWIESFRPKFPFQHQSKLPNIIKEIIDHTSHIAELEKTIASLTNQKIKFPSLFKLYENVGAKMGPISRDPKFSNCVDVLFYFDYHNNQSQLKRRFFGEDRVKREA